MKKKMRSGVTTTYVVMFGVILLITIIILGVVMMNQTGKTIKKMIQKTMMNVSTTAAELIDGDTMASLVEEKDTRTYAYKIILDRLRVFQENADVVYIYAVRQVGEDEYVFIVDADPEDPAQFGESVVITEALRKASTGVPGVDNEPYEDKWGYYYSAYSPVFDSNGEIAGIIGVDFDASWFDDQIQDHIVSLIIIIALAIMIGGAVVLYFSSNVHNRLESVETELSTLSEDIDELADELSSNAGFRHVIGDGGDAEKKKDSENGSADEIETLGLKIRNLHNGLKKYLRYAQSMAYIDAPTGVGNTTAYLQRQEEIKKKMADETADYFLVVFDIDYLKKINDNFGHAEGDKIIKGAAAAIENAFGSGNTYRVGGDEFIAVVENVSENEVKLGMSLVEDAMDKFNGEEECDARLSVSMGFARYDPSTDRSFKDVFIRSDEQMYEKKEEYHKKHG